MGSLNNQNDNSFYEESLVDLCEYEMINCIEVGMDYTSYKSHVESVFNQEFIKDALVSYDTYLKKWLEHEAIELVI